MGLIRFAVHPASRFTDWPEVHRGYLTGADGRIFPTRIEVDQHIITARRSSSESSKLHIAWPVEGYGCPVLHTASLPEREQPYLLPVELARGELVQLRNQAASWELAGMQLPAEFRTTSAAAHRAFGKAAGAQHDPEAACQLADEALQAISRAAEILCLSFAQQALTGRQQRYAHLPLALGCGIGSAPDAEQSDLYCAAFTGVILPVQWTRIEREEGNYDWQPVDDAVAWAEAHRLMPRGGPLIDLGPGGLPEWLAKWDHDVFNLQSFVCDFVETAMSRYLGRIRLWEVVARFNTGGALTLNEEVRLSLAARVLEVARMVDEEAQLIIRVDQPWGEYQARGQHRLSPLQLVDAIIRSGVGLAGVNLEIAMGYQPRCSQYRGLLEFSRLVDQWSVLGVPLHLTLASPSSVGPDLLAQPDLEIEPSIWPGGCEEASQAYWLQQLIPLLLAKPAVASISWSTFSDTDPHEFPRSGLLSVDGSPKRAMETFIDFRHRFAKR
ncbi:glycoside hydrolase [bacterium]|nr:glycoside hydrolase [bacterium]